MGWLLLRLFRREETPETMGLAAPGAKVPTAKERRPNNRTQTNDPRKHPQAKARARAKAAPKGMALPLLWCANIAITLIMALVNIQHIS
jgi:hypothetical protein